VAGEPRLRILARLIGSRAPELQTKRLSDVSAEVTGMSGAGIMLMSGDLPWGSVCTTNRVSALIEELQYALGEGHCMDACHQDRPVFEPDLAHPRVPRWRAFIGPAIEAGVRAVLGFPLQVGAVCLGGLHLYRDRQGPANAPPGKLAAELGAGANFH
jgi:GAF domain-containing protein